MKRVMHMFSLYNNMLYLFCIARYTYIKPSIGRNYTKRHFSFRKNNMNRCLMVSNDRKSVQEFTQKSQGKRLVRRKRNKLPTKI